MPGRRRAREFALQALFAVDVYAQPSDGALRGVWAAHREEQPDAPPITEEEMRFAREVLDGVMARKEDIDARIEAASQNWRLQRMPVVDRNILRVGAFELIARSDIPVSVSINEAIELGKRFGGSDSRSFINGILDRIASDVGRGGRRHHAPGRGAPSKA